MCGTSSFRHTCKGAEEARRRRFSFCCRYSQNHNILSHPYNIVSAMPRVPDADSPGSVPSALPCRCCSVFLAACIIGIREWRELAVQLGPLLSPTPSVCLPSRFSPQNTHSPLTHVHPSAASPHFLYPRLQSLAGGRSRCVAVFIVGWSFRQGQQLPVCSTATIRSVFTRPILLAQATPSFQ
jgi:hypothetical protein